MKNVALFPSEGGGETNAHGNPVSSSLFFLEEVGVDQGVRVNKLWQGIRRRMTSDPNTPPPNGHPPAADSYVAEALVVGGANPADAAIFAVRGYRYPICLFTSHDGRYLLGAALSSERGTVVVTPVQVADIGALDILWNSLYTPSILRQQMDDGVVLAMRVAAVLPIDPNAPTSASFAIVNAPPDANVGWVVARYAAGQAAGGVNEYIICDGWRRRDDVAQIVETRARMHRQALVEAMAMLAAWRGYGALVVGNEEISSHQRFYTGIGFTDLEQVVYYEKPDMTLPAPPKIRLHLPGAQPTENPALHLETRRFDGYRLDERDVSGISNLGRLLTVDNAAFPWLWWNSERELRHYVFQPDVVVYEAFVQAAAGDNAAWDWAAAVGYFSFTRYDRWAHLDRLAVHPQWQGRNIGAHLLDYSIRLMAQAGARRVSLSTQSTNHRSQRLYEGYGFRRVRSLEYQIVGRWLRPPR